MTYVILHGTLDNLSGTISDGAIVTYLLDGVREQPLNYKEMCKKHAEECLCLGNYFSTPQDRSWNRKRRYFVKKKWLELSSLIENQLKEKNRIDLELTDFFEEISDTKEDFKRRLRNIIETLNRGELPTISLVRISNTLDEIGF